MLDLSGRLVHLATVRNPKRHDIIDEIISHGHPSVFATDVSSVPSSVRAIASSFGCRVISPEADLPVEEKEELASAFRFSTLHERDALASAIYAFRKLSPMLERAERVCEGEGVDSDLVKDLVLRGEASNIAEAVKLLRPEVRGERIVVKVPVSTRTVLKLRSNLERAERELKRLKERIGEMGKEIARLRAENERLRRRKGRRVVVRVDVPEDSGLQFTGREGLEEVICLPDYSRKSLYESNITGRVVMFDRNEGSIKMLRKLMPKLVIMDADDFPLPFARPSSASLIRIGDRVYIEKAEVERLLSRPETVARMMKGWVADRQGVER